MLWAITSFFNPAGYKTRLANYRVFRDNLSVPLLAVELSHSSRFELKPGDADILVQITGGDVLWQKERLLNLGLRSLPPECDVVAWLDCDIVFESQDWPARAVDALGEFPLVHLFRERCNAGRGSAFQSVADSIAYRMSLGPLVAAELQDPSGPLVHKSTNGLAWAARRDLLESYKLYDACILGSGDRVMLCAAVGRSDDGVVALSMGARQREHFDAWAQPFWRAVRGCVGYIGGRILHLWHGELSDRGYARRHQGMSSFGYDPYVDIAPAESGCWRWNSDKPDMHEYVRRYFESRREDG